MQWLSSTEKNVGQGKIHIASHLILILKFLYLAFKNYVRLLVLWYLVENTQFCSDQVKKKKKILLLLILSAVKVLKILFLTNKLT